MRYISLPCSTKSSSWPGNTVLRLRTEFVLRLILSVIASRKGVTSFVRWVFADMAQKAAWVDTITEEIFMHRQSLQRRKIPIPPVLTDAEWESLNVPTLFLVGEHEMIYSAQKAVQRLKRTAPHVRSEIILGAGHDLTFVQAAMVNQRILKVPQAGACPVGYVWSVHSLKNESRRGHRSNIPQKGDASR